MNITLANGSTDGDGGAIQNAGDLRLVGVTLSNHQAARGGALANMGTANIQNSGFTQNIISNTFQLGSGGAIYNTNVLMISDCTFNSNQSQGNGGALDNLGMVVITNTTFTTNTAQAAYGTGGTFVNNNGNSGGAIYSLGTLFVADATFTGNQASFGRGGALVTGGAAQIRATTFARNGQSALLNRASLTLSSTQFLNNSSDDQGGGLNNSGTLTATNVTFVANTASFSGCGFYNSGTASINTATFTRNEQAVANTGALTLRASTFDANSGSFRNGGAIQNTSNLTVSASVFRDNTILFGYGGALWNNGSLVVSASLFISNAAPFDSGGAIAHVSANALSIVASTFVSNSADMKGGALYDNGSDRVNLINSTLSSNRVDTTGGSSVGGAIVHDNGTLTILNSTIVSNSAASSGSVAKNGGNVILKNSIIAFGSPDNCAVPLTNDPFNLQYGGSISHSCGSFNNANPLLGPLQDNGGATTTHALLAGSPAIDAGTNAGCPATDQHGVARPIDGNGDGNAVC
ncbi:MAG: hypothetical protein LC737_00330, partial [Chloroflexi bacterium]|nr:hypothetical protein [Chloroflexota bacterium]